MCNNQEKEYPNHLAYPETIHLPAKMHCESISDKEYDYNLPSRGENSNDISYREFLLTTVCK